MISKINSLFGCIIATLYFAAPIYSQDAKLIEAGKKEGKVAAYGSLVSDNADAVFQGFKKKTGIEVAYWRASATRVKSES